MKTGTAPLIAILMGSRSDWETMQHSAAQLKELGVPFEAQVLSAHRAPEALREYVQSAPGRGLQVFIAAAGGAAHLAGVVAARTARPVIGVPMQSASLGGLDSLLSMAQMPAGIPVGTVAIGRAGAVNAALFAAAILALADEDVAGRLAAYRATQTQSVLEASEL